MNPTILQPGYVYWDGSKYTFNNNIVGNPGPIGPAAFGKLLTAFSQPNVGSTVPIETDNAAWAVAGEVVYVTVGGYYSINAVEGNVITIENIGTTGNAPPGTVISPPGNVVPSGPAGGGTTLPFTAGGDLSGVTSNQRVIGIYGNLLPPLTAGNLSWLGSSWAYTQYPTSLSPSGTAQGDLTGNYPAPTLATIGPALGPIGSANYTPVITIDNKGRVTELSSTGINATLEGDLSGTTLSATVTGIRGITVPVPSSPGSVLLYGPGNLSWSTISTIFSPSNDLAGSSNSQTVIGIDGYLLPPLTSGYFNWTGSSWALTALPTIPTSLPPDGYAGGDLTGTYPNPILTTSGVTAGTYGDSSHYAEVTVDAKGRVTSASQTALPTSLTVGGDLYNTTANATVVKIQGQNFASGVPSVGQFVIASSPSGTGYGHFSISGTDVSASATTPGLLKVTGIQGISVTSATPASNTYLNYNGMSLVWTALPTSLPPDGYAGGDLTGSYPNPSLISVGSAGTYGDATHYPLITVDTKGRITSTSLQALLLVLQPVAI